MKVLHVHSGNLYGGVETFLITLARSRHAAPSMEMSVALSFDGRIGDELRCEGVDTRLLGEVRLRRPGSVWKARRALEALLAQDSIDVAVCHQAWPHAVFGPVIKRAHVPLVVWVHMMQNRRHWLEQLAWRTRPDCIVSNSRFTAASLPSSGVRQETIFPPVMTGGCEETLPRVQIRSALGADRDDVVIVQVSRLERMKGHEVMLSALAQLQEHRGWKLWVIGGAQRDIEKAYLDSLRERAERLGLSARVRFVGQRSDVPAVLAGADIFCQPNLQPEGFGISFVEAMGAGLPVVTSAIGGALEIVDQECGLLIPPGDVGALAHALGRLIRDRAERDRFGRAGRVRAGQLCDPAVQTRRIAALMAELS